MTTQPVLVLELFNAQVQYTVPRWQRRYRWSKPDIERLVEDLKTVAGKPIDNRHYTGTILTFPEPAQRSARTGPSGWRGVSVRFLQSAMRSSASSTI